MTVVSTYPVALAIDSADLEGLVYYDVSSSLGEIRLYLPQGLDKDTLQLVDGQLINTTNSTVYPYCPDYPDYTFSASRWSSVQYRTSGSNYTNVELTGVAIQDTYVPLGWIHAIFLFCCLLCSISAVLRGVFRRG